MAASPPRRTAIPPHMSEHQLRVYRIVDGRLDDFVAAWRGGVKPLRERFGFAIEGAWTAPESNEFVWLLRYEGPDSFSDADAAYYASPERTDIQPDPAQFIESASEQMIRPVA